MAIPWVTALHLAKKLLPVVISNAPELLKTFERFRPVSPVQDVHPTDSTLVALQQQIETHQQTITTQAETILQLQTTLSAARRSATRAWTILAVTALSSVAVVLYLLRSS